MKDQAKRITCPMCERPNRALTSTGKIKQHDVPPGKLRTQIMTENLGWAMCPTSGRTPDEAKCIAEQRGLRDDDK